ncbi:MAG: T9SS type A sorting domain-containing protein [Crocinitomicaceae bacterium]|nr:T9SS type A sorting domain-containing protein [Crocinitomicaceae bacterium]
MFPWLDNIVDPSAINQSEQAQIKVYPNPVQEIIYFEGFGDEEVQLFDATGKLIFILEPKESNGSVNVSSLQPGVYYYRSKSVSGKFVKS